MSKIFNFVAFIPRKIYNYTSSLNTLLEGPKTVKEIASAHWEKMTNLFGVCTGSIQLAKGGVDMVEAAICQDGLCFVVSTVGTCADAVQLIGSYVPGGNYTLIVTMPISYGCKSFVWLCKKSVIPNGVCK